MERNNFEFAAKNKLRFPTCRGDITLEQLYDVPLRSRDDFNLNVIAKTVKKSLGTASEENFVDEEKKTPAQAKLEVAFTLVKYVIDSKLEDEATAAKKAENKVKKEKLLTALAEKQDGKLSAMSETELKKQIAALGDDE